MDFPTVAFLTPAAATERYEQLFNDCRTLVRMDEVAALGDFCVEQAEITFNQVLQAAVEMAEIRAGLPTNPPDVEQLKDNAATSSGVKESAKELDEAIAEIAKITEAEFAKTSETGQVAPLLEERLAPLKERFASLKEALKFNSWIGLLPLASQVDYLVHRFLFSFLSSHLFICRTQEQAMQQEIKARVAQLFANQAKV